MAPALGSQAGLCLDLHHVRPSGGRSRKAGQSGKTDRTAIAVIAVDGRSNKYFVDGFRSPHEPVRTLGGVEDAAPEMVVGGRNYRCAGRLREIRRMQSDLEYFRGAHARENDYFSIGELNWPREASTRKKDRVQRLEPDTRAGVFRLPALIHEPGVGDCFWHIDEQQSKIVKIPAKGRTRLQQQFVDGGREHLIAKSIRRLDEDGKIYDVTMALIEKCCFPVRAERRPGRPIADLRHGHRRAIAAKTSATPRRSIRAIGEDA